VAIAKKWKNQSRSWELFESKNPLDEDTWRLDDDEVFPDDSDLESATAEDKLKDWLKHHSKGSIFGIRWYISGTPGLHTMVATTRSGHKHLRAMNSVDTSIGSHSAREKEKDGSSGDNP
jgi:hypothetical protein